MSARLQTTSYRALTMNGARHAKTLKGPGDSGIAKSHKLSVDRDRLEPYVSGHGQRGKLKSNPYCSIHFAFPAFLFDANVQRLLLVCG